MALRRSVEHIDVSQVPQSLPVVLFASESAKSSSRAALVVCGCAVSYQSLASYTGKSGQRPSRGPGL